MKIILSRKGFDSSVGGHPSPIFPDGRMISLPIPSSHDTLPYDDFLALPGKTCGQLLAELGGRSRIAGKGAHLDPDLIPESRPRKAGWLPSLGQIGAAGGHLRKQAVGPGDLFLFYGWFQPARETGGGRVAFDTSVHGFHAIFGYLEVGEVLAADRLAGMPDWLRDHPHAAPSRLAKSTNTIYVATPRLSWRDQLPGGGPLKFNPGLVLTKAGQTRSRWNLDPVLFRHLTISYHSEVAWRDGYFQSYPRAQEYVVQADGPAADWARALVAGGPS